MSQKRMRKLLAIFFLLHFSFSLSLSVFVPSAYAAADVQQIHYRWRNDNGGEAANSVSWYNGDWKYRQSIVIDNTDVAGTANFTNFPVLISFTDTDLKDTTNGGHVGQSDAGDILFTNSSGTKLDHEIEEYSPSTGALVAWVEVDTLDYNDDTTLYIYFGNASVANQWNTTGVWDSNYKLVQHLEEATTTATGYLDSTSNANDSDAVTIDGTGSNVDATGKAGGAVQFDGSNDNIRVPDDATLDLTSNITLELWYNADTLPGSGRLRGLFVKSGNVVSSAAGTDINYSLTMDNGLNAAGQNLTFGFENSSHVQQRAYVNFSSTAGTWYHLVGVFDDTANTVTLYRNGTQVAQTTGVTTTPSTNNYNAYAAVDNAANLSAVSEYFDGTLDEIRLSDTARSADWISTEYANQNSPGVGGFLTSIGAEEVFSATWAATEDAKLIGIAKSVTYRLRLELSNEGDTSNGGATHQLQVAEGTNCSALSYAAVPTDTSGDWKIQDSTYLTDAAASTNVTSGLTDESTTFVAGVVKDTGNTTASITLASNEFTEIEFSLQATTNATDGGNYCFKLTNATTVSSYAKVSIAGGTPVYTQSYYRWYVDNDGTNPTDAWGNPDLAENATLSPLPTSNSPPDSTTELRLRINLVVATANLIASGQQFKLQFKAGTDGSCTTDSWTDVGAAQTWVYATSSVTDGALITKSLSTSDISGHYAKSSPTATNTNVVDIGQSIEYDFHLVGTNTSPAKRYSFRMVKSDGTALTTYTNCPTLTTKPGTDNLLRHGKFFSEEAEQGLSW